MNYNGGCGVFVVVDDVGGVLLLLLLPCFRLIGQMYVCVRVCVVCEAATAVLYRLVSGQFGEGRVHLVGQRLVSVLVDAQLVCGSGWGAQGENCKQIKSLAKVNTIRIRKQRKKTNTTTATGETHSCHDRNGAIANRAADVRNWDIRVRLCVYHKHCFRGTVGWF